MAKLLNFSAACVLGAMLSTIALAETPNDVRDIVGAHANSGESKLRGAGYTHISTQKGSDRTYSYWWNSRKSRCISVATLDGRYNSIETSPAFDCNQSAGENSDDDNNTGAAVAIGAAALIGALALSHKSHHHNQKKHNDNVDREAEFDRGYRDGLHGRSFDNYNSNDSYLEGYNSGVDQNRYETSYRSRDSYHGDRHNGQAHHSSSSYKSGVNTSDLVGARASGADQQMRNRGFRNVGEETSGYTAYSIWWNHNTRQCMQMAVADGRVDSLVDIHRHSGCR
jgi:hypothetical protein